MARVEQGESFGELGLLLNERRTATAVCLERTSLLVLKRNIFEQYLSQSKNAKMSVMIDYYSSLWLFRDLTEKEIIRLAVKTTLTHCSKGTVLIN